jgi:hypothetical protein
LLIGIATWSYDELCILDELNQLMGDAQISVGFRLRVDVFSLLALASMSDFRSYYPNEVEAYSTPVVGLWNCKSFRGVACGVEATQMIFDTIEWARSF